MTTAALPSAVVLPAQGPTLAVAAGRNLVAAGAIFGAANLFQYGVTSGALGLHPAVLSLSWPLAVGLFLTILFRLRRSGGEAALRAGRWSRFAILGQIAGAMSLLGASYVTGNWGLMKATAVVGMALYGAAWTIATLRGGRPWMGGVAVGCFATAGGMALMLGAPGQYAVYACGLLAFGLLPGFLLASGRAQ
jgi:hypothetical protein